MLSIFTQRNESMEDLFLEIRIGVGGPSSSFVALGGFLRYPSGADEDFHFVDLDVPGLVRVSVGQTHLQPV